MKKFHELPKDILVQLLVNINNLSSLTYEELEERERNIATEKKRRKNVKKCEVIKYSLLQLKFFPHLKRFIEENTDTINSIEMVSWEEYYPKLRIKGIDYAIGALPQLSPFLEALSNLYIKPDWNSLLNEISKYIGADGYGGNWLTATQIDYNLCVICNKKQVLFQYERCSKCLGIAADDTVYYTRVCIVTCSNCGKIHCINHDCEN